MNARRVDSYGDFDGLGFVAKIGFEKGMNGYREKKILEAVITPDKPDWTKVEPVRSTHSANAAFAAQATTSPAAGSVPDWAWWESFTSNTTKCRTRPTRLGQLHDRIARTESPPITSSGWYG